MRRPRIAALEVVRRGGLAVVLGLALGGCQTFTASEPPAWRSDCPRREQPAPLSMEAARAAYRVAERRHQVQMREAAEPGFFLRTVGAALEPRALAAGRICLSDVADLGEMVFEHEYGFADGLGAGAAATATTGPFRRVHAGDFGGPETISCRSCHWVGGPNGAGAETDNVFLMGDGVRTASADERNPPALVGLGVVEALAREMSQDLQRQRDEVRRASARAGEPRTTRLTANGVDFGELRVGARGEVDTSAVRGVDADLIVKPFGWKGTRATFAEFATDALQQHFGIQNAELLAHGSAPSFGEGSDPADPDQDGVRDELGRGPFTAMVVHLALLEVPVIEPLGQTHQMAAAAQGLLPPTSKSFAEDFQRGRRQFHALGCAECHVPMLVLKKPTVEVEGVPPIQLASAMRAPALTYDEAVGGYPVWLFSDLKRHDMGPANAARHAQRGVEPNQYLTPRLWGVADSAPYLHDGRAPSFDYALAGHDGEGAAARAAFAALSMEDKGALRVYLMSLRRASRVMVP